MNNCIVTIPIYKVTPNSSEMASFRQCLVLLKNYDISVLTYEELDISSYKKIATEVGKNYKVEYFDQHFFKSIEGYNNLCFSIEFYERFQQYEYMFIYQLDAWVFRDELQMWCNKGYDYIGAPIFYAYNHRRFTTKFCGVGNGGFSLRRISHCLNILRSNKNRIFLKPLPLIQLYWNYFLYSEKFTENWKKRLSIIPILILKFFGKYNTISYFIEKNSNEDMIFGTFSSKSWSFQGNIPRQDEASRFSFELHPEMLYHQLGDNLPFGCHAFEKWDYESFWYKYIKL